MPHDVTFSSGFDRLQDHKQRAAPNGPLRRQIKKSITDREPKHDFRILRRLESASSFLLLEAVVCKAVETFFFTLPHTHVLHMLTVGNNTPT